LNPQPEHSTAQFIRHVNQRSMIQNHRRWNL